MASLGKIKGSWLLKFCWLLNWYINQYFKSKLPSYWISPSCFFSCLNFHCVFCNEECLGLFDPVWKRYCNAILSVFYLLILLLMFMSLLQKKFSKTLTWIVLLYSGYVLFPSFSIIQYLHRLWEFSPPLSSPPVFCVKSRRATGDLSLWKCLWCRKH